MKNLCFLNIGAALVFFTGRKTCPPCPQANINVPVVISPFSPPVFVPFEKGEFDKTDEERGYKILTDEEVQELFEKYQAPDSPEENKTSCRK